MKTLCGKQLNRSHYPSDYLHVKYCGSCTARARHFTTGQCRILMSRGIRHISWSRNVEVESHRTDINRS